MRSVSWRQLAGWLAAALLLPLYYEVLAWRAAGTLGFPLDDAWIHAQFARNLATGHGFTYTGSRWVAGSTSPAWTILLALGYVVTRSALIAGKGLGLVLQLACGVLAARFVLALTGHRALAVAGAAIILTTPAMVWGALSGMEIGLTCALVLGGFHLYLTAAGEQPRRQLAGVFLLALASLARPESLVLFGIVAIHLVVRSRSIGASARAAASVVAIALVVIGPFMLFDYVTTGRPLPTTYYAKSGPGLLRVLPEGNRELTRRLFFTHAPNAVWQFGETLFNQYGVVATVMFAGFAAAFTRSLRRKGAALVAISVVAGCLAMGLVAPMRLKPENFRYTAQLVCLASVLGCAGLSILWPLLKRPAARCALLVALVAVICYQSIDSARVYAGSVKNIEQLHVTLARWMRSHLLPGTTVAVNDIGALAYFGGHDIIDLEGLVSPEALAHPRAERGIGFTRETRPDYIAIFPSWYPDISGRPDLFHEVYRVSIADNYVSAGDVLVVYSTPWTRYPPIPGPVKSEKRRRWPA
jgi:hypothetical protein